MRSGLRRPLMFGIGLVACGVLSGCVQETQQGETFVYTYALWAKLTAVFGPLAALCLGIALIALGKAGRFAWVMILLGGGYLLFGMPSMFLDSLTARPDGFQLHSGIWMFPDHHDVKYDDVSTVTETAEKKTGRRGRKRTEYYVNFQRKSGGAAKISSGDDLFEAAAEKILVQVVSRGIAVQDQTGGQ